MKNQASVEDVDKKSRDYTISPRTSQILQTRVIGDIMGFGREDKNKKTKKEPEMSPYQK